MYIESYYFDLGMQVLKQHEQVEMMRSFYDFMDKWSGRVADDKIPRKRTTSQRRSGRT